jgi:hypothetical protein
MSTLRKEIAVQDQLQPPRKPWERMIPRSGLNEFCLGHERELLPASVRSSFEERCRTRLAAVFIRRGPAAARLCALLEARALVWENEIFVADRHWLFDTEHSWRVLAHELVHILQQQSKGCSSQEPVVPLGNPEDPYEVEADRIANDLLAGSLISVPTGDASGAIRRTFTVAPTPNMVMMHDGVIPGVSYPTARRVATLHLTKNSGRLLALGEGRTKDQVRDASAIQITANITVVSDDSRDLSSSDLKFHFIQFFKLKACSATYGGLTSSGGRMILDYAAPPSFPQQGQYMLDAAPGSDSYPYVDMYAPVIRKIGMTPLWNVALSMYDHPNFEHPLVLPNDLTRAKNYLCAANFSYDIMTVVLVRDLSPVKPVNTALGSITWSAVYACTFPWARDGSNVSPARLMRKEFQVSDTVTGSPGDRTVAAMIKDPSDDPADVYNVAADQAKSAVGHATTNTPNFEQSNSWDDFDFSENFR